MQTPWGDLRVADAHAHFFSHGFFAALVRQKGLEPTEQNIADIGARLGWQMPPRAPDRLAEVWLRELAACGVSRSVLIASVPGDEDSVEVAVSCFPNRLIGYFMLDPTAPDAVARTQRALARGLRGICLYPAMHRFSIGEERVRPILELAQARPGTVVFVHCGVLTVGIRKKLGLPSPFDLRFSNPVELHAVALRYPEVPFVIPHFGAGYFREALMVADLCPNVHLDTSSSNSWIRYQEEGCTLARVFRRALDVAGPGRLLFGTDSSYFPRGWNREVFDAQVSALQEVGVGVDAARAIFGGNLERLAGTRSHAA